MSDIITELTGGILDILFNRPAKKNAMTSAMYVSFAEILNGAAKDGAVRVVLWHSAGDAFCAGNDLEDFLKSAPDAREGGETPQARLMSALLDFDKPIVAAVHGAAVGGGTTLLAHCDLVYAGENAFFQLPFINLALVPEFGSSATLPARFGHARAAELFMLGQRFSAATAAELGLVTRVVPDEEVLAAATDIARQLAAKPSGSLRATKRLLKRAFRAVHLEAFRAEGEEFVARLGSAEAKEAMNAFFEKRSPDFTKARVPGAMAK